MYYFIVNPNSRSGAGALIWEQVRKELKNRQVPYEAYLTRYVGHAASYAAEISSKGTSEDPVYLITLGGDGTIYEVLTGITDLDHVIFGYIPTGSGNDFCRSMKISQDPLEALDTILKKECIQAMDVPYILTGQNKYRFGISAGIGYDAAVCQEVLATPAKKVFNRLGLGKLIYLYVALKQLLFLNPAPMTICLDGQRKYNFRKVYFTAVMNQKYEGGGFKFCPRAKYNDGILDVIIVEGMSRLKVLACLPTAFFGKHTHFKGIHILRCKSIEINSAVPAAVHKDGESGGIQGRIYVSLEDKPVKIILPRQ
jgi:YegS/Rv2252/BmrU family lipid kinase